MAADIEKLIRKQTSIESSIEEYRNLCIDGIEPLNYEDENTWKIADAILSKMGFFFKYSEFRQKIRQLLAS